MTFGIEIFITEIIGIIAFAISGAIVGIKKHFDLFGIIVLGQPVPKANAQFFIYKRRENGKQVCYET